MSKVTIGLIQLETRLGDKEYNLALAQEKVREAAAQGAKIICLPELFVTGYNLDVYKRQGIFRRTKRAATIWAMPFEGNFGTGALQQRRAGRWWAC